MLNNLRRWCSIKRCCVPYNKNYQYTCDRQELNVKEINYNDLLTKIKEGGILIDVRNKQEFLEGHLEGAILIPYYEIRKKIVSIIPNKDQTIILYCQNGGRSLKAYEILNKIGYANTYNLNGGLERIFHN